jgi:hypothetical protein
LLYRPRNHNRDGGLRQPMIDRGCEQVLFEARPPRTRRVPYGPSAQTPWTGATTGTPADDCAESCASPAEQESGSLADARVASPVLARSDSQIIGLPVPAGGLLQRSSVL